MSQSLDEDPKHLRVRSAKERLRNRERSRAYYATHREACLAYQKARQETKRDAIRQQKHAHYLSHAEAKRAYARAYRQAHLDEVRAKDRAYAQAHRDKLIAYKKAYYVANRITSMVKVKAWKQTHPDAVKAIQERHRARRRTAPDNDLTAAQWAEIKQAYDHRCAYCGKKLRRLTMDHLTPLSQGGAHTATNIVPACQSCNSRKAAGAPLVSVQPLLFTLAPPGKKKL